MGDIALDNFKKSVARLVDDWTATLDEIGKKLAKNAAEIEKLEAIKSPTADDKKRLEACKATREKLRQEVESANTALKASLIILTKNLPDKTKDNEKDLIDLPNWARRLIKDKGVQVLKGVTLAPTLDIDFKSKSLKSFGIKITW